MEKNMKVTENKPRYLLFLKRFYEVTFVLVSGWNLATSFNITSWWCTDL